MIPRSVLYRVEATIETRTTLEAKPEGKCGQVTAVKNGSVNPESEILIKKPIPIYSKFTLLLFWFMLL